MSELPRLTLQCTWCTLGNYVFGVCTVGSRQRVQGRKKPKKTPRGYIKLGSTAENMGSEQELSDRVSPAA